MHIVDKVRIFSRNNIPYSIQLSFTEGFYGGSVVKNPPPMQETQEKWVRSLGCKDSLEEGTAIHSSILVWRIPMDRGAWRAIVHRVAKSGTEVNEHA